MKEKVCETCGCPAEASGGSFPGEPDEVFFSRSRNDREMEHSSCLCIDRTQEGKEELPLAGRSPLLDEKSLSAGMLKSHLPPKGMAGKVIVHQGKLHLVREKESKTVTVVPGAPAWIRPGEYHHLEIAGPVKFHVEFYRISGAGKECGAALRPGEAFLEPQPEKAGEK